MCCNHCGCIVHTVCNARSVRYIRSIAHGELQWISKYGQVNAQDNKEEIALDKRMHDLNANGSSLLSGEVRFAGDIDDGPKRTAKFVKINADTTPRDVIHFMREQWGIQTPEVLIAVTGGANDFPLTGHCRAFFRRKLIGQALNTDAWIVSGGTYCGVMKHVGEAVLDYGYRGNKKGIVLGIATWNTLYNKTDMMEHLQSGSEFLYHVKERKALPNQTSCLDPNHTHFILVDSSRDEFGEEVEFRNEFIDYLSKCNDVKFNVCVLLEGGLQSLRTVRIAASVNTPVVVIGGTGRLAKVLSNVFDAHSRQKPWVTYAESEADSILGPGRRTLGPSYVIDLIRDCLVLKENFSFCRVGDDSYLQGKIIYALIQDSRVEWRDRMKQALLWNISAVAKAILRDEDGHWNPEDLFPFLIDAVCENKVHFVKVFLYYGVTVYKRLTLEKLREIYSKVEKDSFLHRLMTAKSKKVESMHPAYCLLHNYLENKYPNRMVDEFQELFIYAVLQNQMEMAELFWGYSREPLAAALTATSLLQAMSSSRNNLRKFPDECADMEKSARRMEELATGLLDECRDDNQRDTARILRAHRPNWGGSCFEIGLSGYAKLDFASHNSVQNILDELWTGDVEMNNSYLAILMATFFPLLLHISGFVGFKNEHDVISNDAEIRRTLRTRGRHQETNGSHDYTEVGGQEDSQRCPANGGNGVSGGGDEMDGTTGEGKSNRLTFLGKLSRFYSGSPKIKFRLHWVSYIIFLLYMSYVMLFEFRPTMTIYEMALIFWVATFLCEEIRQVFDTNGACLRKKLDVYLHDPWNKLDVACHSLFLLGIILRCFPQLLFHAGRTVLCLTLILFYTKSLQIFLRFKKVGPKLLMIGRMLVDLMLFLGIMAVFLLSYGIASHAILYPNDTGTVLDAIRQLLLKSYFQVFGELFLDVIYGQDGCVHNATMIAAGYTPCPENSWTGILLLGGYMLISNVLLLNLLIAMFSFTFEQVQENTDALWKYHRYKLIQEYTGKSSMVPPFIVLPMLLRLWRYLSARTCKRIDNPSGDSKDEDGGATLPRGLVKWERLMLEYYLAKLTKEEEGNVRERLNLLHKRFDRLERFINNQYPVASDRRDSSLEP